jgi:hypothetical protein
MDKVKEFMALGLTVPSAIRAALDANGIKTVVAFCDKYGIPRGSGSNHLNATTIATDQTIDALVEELGGTPNEWRELLWQAMKPAHLAAAAS